MQRSRWPRSGLKGAAVRFVGLLGASSLFVLVAALPVGVLTHANLNRAISVGFYLVGALLVVIGFAGGSRGPFRSDPGDDGSIRVGRRLRRATVEELNETMSVAAIVIAIGLVLLVIGVAIDNRHTLF